MSNKTKDYKRIGSHILANFINNDSSSGLKLIRILDELSSSMTDSVTGDFTALLSGLTEEGMREYDIALDVLSVYGSQTFRVKAKSEEDALLVFKSEGGELVSTDLKVQELDNAELFNVFNVEET
jgi:hypothetical protein